MSSNHGPERHSTEAKTIFLVAGARPNFIKLAPLYNALKDRPGEYNPIVVHTGQHYDRNMSDVFFKQLGIPEPDISLGIGSGTHGLQTGKVLIEIEKAMIEHRPDMVIVFGDVNSTLAAALAAVKLGIPVAHVEAGLRSNDWSMPEEVNRVIADRVSTLLFTTCEDANINLLREGVPEDSIHFVGNIMIDSLCRFLPEADTQTIINDLKIEPQSYVLVTMHRPGNVDSRGTMEKVVSMLGELAVVAPVVFPMHPRTRKNLLECELSSTADGLFDNPNIRIVEPLGYLEFLKLEKEAAVVVTDSGGIQEETTYLGVPCLTVRPNTERPVTITDGTNILIGLKPDRVVAFAKEFIEGDTAEKRLPILWDGKTAGRIVGSLDEFFGLGTQSHPAHEQMVDDSEIVRSRA